MQTEQMTGSTPVAARLLVRMHQLLWQASAEADRRARASRDLVTVALANNLTYACDRVFHLLPTASLDALLDRPEVTGADPVDLARQAVALSRTQPLQDFPPGMASVLVLLIDTVGEFS